MSTPPLSAIELCCGAGAMTTGLTRAGLTVKGLERNPDAVASARKNSHDVELADVNDYPFHQHHGTTIVAGGVPCQPFSRMGLGLGMLDTSRDCFPAAIRAIAEIEPQAVIFENVVGLTFAKHTDYLAAITGAIADLGYHVAHRIIDCADYGTPQHRRRLILLATRHGLEPPIWPDPTHGPGRAHPHVTVAEALGWAPDDPRRHANEGVMEQIQAETRRPQEPGRNDKWSQIVLDHQPWMWERPATTIAGRPLLTTPGANANTTNGALKGKNDGVRITFEQMTRLQGLPADYQLVGNKGSQAVQAGNMFPPQPAQALAEAMIAIIARAGQAAVPAGRLF